ncbi:DUF2141 domain-containing protein [Sandarakinorhabdus rubra]|uniref:DUF2141 domain-containing protein n=1 Tax=Sandarakinorhabdus rubra TaxID=2672568 RepID=UPI0013DC2796|nr:DUF2141 domain-containing protein [Sandarakinorhabdus rubra]
MIRHCAIIGPALLLAGAAHAQLASNPNLGKAEGQCRPNETGPAVIITAVGLKDRKGLLRAELYPANEADFLEDDNILLNAGKTFRRVEISLPPSGPVQLCIRTPGPGAYTLSMLHDRDSNLKFGLSSDGVGFPNNPRLGLGKPKAAAVTFQTGPGLTPISIRLNYRRGLLSFGPLKEGG